MLADPGPDVTLKHVLTGRITKLAEPGMVAVAGHRQAVNRLRSELGQAAPGLEVRLAGNANPPRKWAPWDSNPQPTEYVSRCWRSKAQVVIICCISLF